MLSVSQMTRHTAVRYSQSRCHNGSGSWTSNLKPVKFTNKLQGPEGVRWLFALTAKTTRKRKRRKKKGQSEERERMCTFVCVCMLTFLVFSYLL